MSYSLHICYTPVKQRKALTALARPSAPSHANSSPPAFTARNSTEFVTTDFGVGHSLAITSLSGHDRLAGRLGCRECSVERPQDQVCLWSSEHALDRAKNELTCKGVPKCVLQAFPTYNTMNCSCLTRLLSSIAQKENQGTLEHHQKQNNIFQIDFRRRLLTYFATGVRHSQRHGLF